MFRFSLQRCLNLSSTSAVFQNARLMSTAKDQDVDKLFSKITIEVRGHEKAVLLSYTTFLKNACNHLEIDSSDIRDLPPARWLQWALKSKFVHKKAKLQYETITHIKQMDVFHLTGSTASTLLEYIQRNIPEGVAMKVDYNELCMLPESVRKAIIDGSSKSTA